MGLRPGLSTQAREANARALAASPNDPRANAAVGNVQVNGHWVSEEEGYRAKGYVQFEGEWMTPAEQAVILRERAADAEGRVGAWRASDACERRRHGRRRRKRRPARPTRRRKKRRPAGHPALVRLGSGARHLAERTGRHPLPDAAPVSAVTVAAPVLLQNANP